MSVFGKIRDAIFGRKASTSPADQSKPGMSRSPQAQHAQFQPAQPRSAQPGTAQPRPVQAGPASAPVQPAVRPSAQTTATQVDVEAVLEDLASRSDQKLNWRTSIVDLMKLLGMDSSLSERKELAQELGYTGPLDGSAEMNIWLHKRVMRELAANGGKVPPALMD